MVLIERHGFHLKLERPLNAIFPKSFSIAEGGHDAPRQFVFSNADVMHVRIRIRYKCSTHQRRSPRSCPRQRPCRSSCLDTNVRQRGIGGVNLQPKMVAATSEAVEAVARTYLARWWLPGTHHVNTNTGWHSQAKVELLFWSQQEVLNNVMADGGSPCMIP